MGPWTHHDIESEHTTSLHLKNMLMPTPTSRVVIEDF